MARGFNLTAEINLRGPANIRQVVSNIRRQLGTINANVNVNINNRATRNITALNSRLTALNATLNQTTTAAGNAATAFNNLATAIAAVGSARLPTNLPQPIINTTRAATNATRALAETRTEFEDFGRQAGLAVRRFAAFSSVTAVIYGFNNAISNGIKQYIEFDRQLTRLSQVTNESKSGLKGLVDEITSLSTSLGVASADLTTVSVTLAQAGLNAAETRRALEALAKSALAPSFDNLNETVEGSIALMRQFGISAGQLESALGSVNAVAAAFAVEAGDIIKAIQRTGGVFAAASKGVSSGTESLNEFIAVFTSVRATTRESAETIATGLRTIFTRIQRSDTIEALKEYGVVLTDLEGKFVGPYAAVQRLAEGLGRLDPRDLKFSQIVEELGGFRQIGKVLPLIQQFSTAQEALKVAQQGQGSLAVDAAKGQLALAVQIQKVREEFSALMRSFGESDSFKTMAKLGLDLASALIKVANATKGLLPLVGIMAAFRGVSAITQFAGGFGGGFRGGNNRRASGGGRIYGFAGGGLVPGSGNTDSVPAMLTPGEFVVNKRAVNKYGRGNLVKINNYKRGGTVWSKQDPGSGSGTYGYEFTHLDVALRPTLQKKAKGATGYGLSNVGIMLPRTMNQVWAGQQNVLGQETLKKIRTSMRLNDQEPIYVAKEDLITEIAEQTPAELFSSLLQIDINKKKTRNPSGGPTERSGTTSARIVELQKAGQLDPQYVPEQSSAYRTGAGTVRRGIRSIKPEQSINAEQVRQQLKAALLTGAEGLQPKIEKDTDLTPLGEALGQAADTLAPELLQIRELDVAGYQSIEKKKARQRWSQADQTQGGTIVSGKLKYRAGGGKIQKFLDGGWVERMKTQKTKTLEQEYELLESMLMLFDTGERKAPANTFNTDGARMEDIGKREATQRMDAIYDYLHQKKLEDKRKFAGRKGPGLKSTDQYDETEMLDAITLYQAGSGPFTRALASDKKKFKDRGATYQTADIRDRLLSASQFDIPKKTYSGLGKSQLKEILRKTGITPKALASKPKETLQSLVGQTIDFPTFLSVSAAKSQAEAFVQNPGALLSIDGGSASQKTIDVIKAKGKTKIQTDKTQSSRRLPGLDKIKSSKMDFYDQEKEFIIPPNTSFQITKASGKVGDNLSSALKTKSQAQDSLYDLYFDEDDEDFEKTRLNLQAKMLNRGGLVQNFMDGGVAQRKVGYIDYDVIANPANETAVAKGMESTGVKGPRLYTDKLTELAVAARKSASIDKLRAIYGVAGSGKTTLARGQGTDDAKLRKTERFPILTPEDIDRATEILILSSSVSNKKMDEFFGDVDRAYTLSSTTQAEKENVRSQRVSRDVTGIGLEGRTPGVTSGVDTDTAVGEALLADKLGDKSVVLGRTDDKRIRRKRGNELVEVVKKKIGFTWGGFSPMTAGHESIMDAAAAMGISPEDFIYLVGANESIKAGDPSSYRTAIFDQDARVLLAKAGAGAKGATVLPKPRDFEVPQAFDISEETGRRKVLIPGEGSTTFVADKTEQQTEKYKQAGYKVATIERTEGISGTMVRDLIAQGDLGKLKDVLSPGVYDLISKNISQIQNRANVLPSLIEQVEKTQGVELDDINKQIKAVGISRIDKKKMDDPEYAAKVAVLEELRAKRDKIKASSGFTPYKLLSDLEKSQPDKYALQFMDGGAVQRFPTGGEAQKPRIRDRVSAIARKKEQSIQQTILEQLRGLNGGAGVRKILGIPGGDATARSVLNGNSINAGKNLDKAQDYINRALFASGTSDAAEAKRVAALTQVAIAGLVPYGYSDGFEWNLPDSKKTIYATVKGFDEKYIPAAQAMSKKTASAAKELAEEMQYIDIFDETKKNKQQLVFDFDDTLVKGGDILGDDGRPDVTKYGDLKLVEEALKQATLTSLGTKLKSLIELDPNFINTTRILTARPQSTVSALATKLQQLGLPYQEAQIKGVGGMGLKVDKAKASDLAENEKIIDDNIANILAARKSKKAAFLYTEPQAKDELDELMGQGNIEGAVVEKALAILGANLPPIETLEQNRAIDFPGGLGRAAQFFGLPNDIPTEVKRTLNGDSFEKAREEFDRYYKEQTVALAGGGAVALYHGSNTGVDDNVLKSFQTIGAMSNIAQGYGQGAGFFVYSGKERAKQQAMMRVGGGSGFTVASGDTTGRPMVVSFREVLDPATWDLDYELNKGSVVQWLYDNYQSIKDKLQPDIEQGLTGIRDVIHKDRDQGIMSAGVRVQSGTGARKTLYAGTDADIREGELVGQIMDRLKAQDPQMVADFENQFFNSPALASGAWDNLALKYVGSSPLKPVNIETFADGGSVPALVSNGEAYVPPKLAKRIGYSRLNRMNQADRNGMGRFSEGGISVFKGPGTGTSDSIPANLPVGSFIIREKATKALGLNSGGRVQRFFLGGRGRAAGPAARPDVASAETLGAASATTALTDLANVLDQLGVRGSESARLLNQGYQATIAAAREAMSADLAMAQAAGATAETIFDLTEAIREAERAGQAEIALQQNLANISGAQIEDVFTNVQARIRQLQDIEETNLRSTPTASGNMRTEAEIQAELRTGAAARSEQAYRDEAASGGLDLAAIGATGDDFARVLRTMSRDTATFNQMNQRYIANRRDQIANELAAAGEAARAARVRSGLDRQIEQQLQREVGQRRQAMEASARSEGASSPGAMTEEERRNRFQRNVAMIAVGQIVADVINAKSSSTEAGISGAIRGGTRSFGALDQTQQELARFADTARNSSNRLIRTAGNLSGRVSRLVGRFQLLLVAAEAAREAYNAIREFAIELQKKRVETALDGLAEEFDKLSKDINRIDIRNQIETRVIAASEAAAKLRDKQQNTASAGLINAFDVLGSNLRSMYTGDPTQSREAALRSQVLNTEGVIPFLKTYFSGTQGVESKRAEYSQISGRETAAIFKPVADNVNQVIAARIKAGESVADIEASPEAAEFARTLTYADAALAAHIRSIELDTTLTEAQKQARINDIISIEGGAKRRAAAELALREKTQKNLGNLASVYTRSLQRMFNNMEQAINKTSFALDRMKTSIDLSTAALQGQAKAGQTNLQARNILQNPTAYSGQEVQSAAGLGGSMFGARSAEMSQLAQLPELITGSVMSTINQTIRDQGGNVTNEALTRVIDKNLRAKLKDLGLPPELADKIAKEAGASIVDIRKEGEDNVDYTKLSEKIAGLGSVVDSAKSAQQAVIKALENYQNILNLYTDNINKIIELETSAREKSRKSILLAADASVSLAKALGRTIKAADAFAKRDADVARQTGGLTDPEDIFQQILALNTSRGIQQESADKAAEQGLSGAADFAKFNNELKNTSIALRENRSALEDMANNTEKASAAMDNIQQAQQKAAGRVGFLEKVVTSTPDELESLNGALMRLQRNMNGQQNTIQNSVGAQKAYIEAINNGATAADAMRAAQTAFANERKETVGALQDILPFLGDTDQANNIRANVLETMLNETGMGVSPMMQQVLNSLRNPEQDPATAAAIQYYNEAIAEQAAATRLLGQLDQTLADDIAQSNSKLLLDGLKNTILTFQNSELNDIKNDVNAILAIQRNPPAAPPGGVAGAPGIATGGLIYAAAGQLVNFQPKGTDTVPAMLTPGEFVVNRASTQKHLPLLRSINNNSLSAGGQVSYYSVGGIVTDLGDEDNLKNINQISKFDIIQPGAANNRDIWKTANDEIRGLPYAFTARVGANGFAAPENMDYGLDSPKFGVDGIDYGIMPGIRRDGYRYSYTNNNAALAAITNPAILKNANDRIFLPETLSSFKPMKSQQEDTLKGLKDFTNLTTVNPNPIQLAVRPDTAPATTDVFKQKNAEIETSLFDTTKVYGVFYKGLAGSSQIYNDQPADNDTKSLKILRGYTWSTFGGMSPDAVANTNDSPKFRPGSPYETYTNEWNKVKAGLPSVRVPLTATADEQGQIITDIDKLNQINTEQAALIKNTQDYAKGAPTYEDMGINETQNKLYGLYQGTIATHTFTKPDTAVFDKNTDISSAGSLTVAQKTFEQDFQQAYTNAQANKETLKARKIKFGFAGAADPDLGINQYMKIIESDAPGGREEKDFVFMVNGTLDLLGKDFKQKAEEEAVKNLQGNIRSSLKNQSVKIDLPIPDMNQQLDIPISYEQYTGKLFDQVSKDFVDPEFTYLLPTNIKSTLFQDLDTTNRRLFTNRLYDGPTLVAKSNLADPAVATSLRELLAMQVNKDPNYEAQAARFRALPKLVFDEKPSSLIKYLGKDVNIQGAAGLDIFSDLSNDPLEVPIGTFLLEKLKELQGTMAGQAGKVDQSMVKKGAILGDEEARQATLQIIQASMAYFGNLGGIFPSGWVGKFGGRQAAMLAARGSYPQAASFMSGLFNQAGGYVSQLSGRANSVAAYNRLNQMYTLISGAANVFADLANGNTALLKQFMDNKGSPDLLFRSYGLGAKFGKVSGMKLTGDWQNILATQLEGTKIKTVGRNGTLAESSLATALPEGANVTDLVKVLFNPYNEFPQVDTRKNLIKKFGDDLFRLRGPNPYIPYFDPRTLQFIETGLTRLMRWYGGSGDWVGQDYFFDTAVQPDNAARIKEFNESFAAAGGTVLKEAQEAHVAFGLANNFGALPGPQWFAARAAQMGIDNQREAQNKADGGVVYASTGKLINFQPRGTDTVPAMLTPGEFVVNRAATQKHLPLLRSINSGSSAPAPYSKGGVVYLAEGGVAASQGLKDAIEVNMQNPYPEGVDPDKLKRTLTTNIMADLVAQKNNEQATDNQTALGLKIQKVFLDRNLPSTSMKVRSIRFFADTVYNTAYEGRTGGGSQSVVNAFAKKGGTPDVLNVQDLTAFISEDIPTLSNINPYLDDSWWAGENIRAALGFLGFVNEREAAKNDAADQVKVLGPKLDIWHSILDKRTDLKGLSQRRKALIQQYNDLPRWTPAKETAPIMEEIDYLGKNIPIWKSKQAEYQQRKDQLQGIIDLRNIGGGSVASLDALIGLATGDTDNSNELAQLNNLGMLPEDIRDEGIKRGIYKGIRNAVIAATVLAASPLLVPAAIGGSAILAGAAGLGLAIAGTGAAIYGADVADSMIERTEKQKLLEQQESYQTAATSAESIIDVADVVFGLGAAFAGPAGKLLTKTKTGKLASQGKGAIIVPRKQKSKTGPGGAADASPPKKTSTVSPETAGRRAVLVEKLDLEERIANRSQDPDFIYPKNSDDWAPVDYAQARIEALNKKIADDTFEISQDAIIQQAKARFIQRGGWENIPVERLSVEQVEQQAKRIVTSRPVGKPYTPENKARLIALDEQIIRRSTNADITSQAAKRLANNSPDTLARIQAEIAARQQADVAARVADDAAKTGDDVAKVSDDTSKTIDDATKAGDDTGAKTTATGTEATKPQSAPRSYETTGLFAGSNAKKYTAVVKKAQTELQAAQQGIETDMLTKFFSDGNPGYRLQTEAESILQNLQKNSDYQKAFNDATSQGLSQTDSISYALRQTNNADITKAVDDLRARGFDIDANGQLKTNDNALNRMMEDSTFGDAYNARFNAQRQRILDDMAEGQNIAKGSREYDQLGKALDDPSFTGFKPRRWRDYVKDRLWPNTRAKKWAYRALGLGALALLIYDMFKRPDTVGRPGKAQDLTDKQGEVVVPPGGGDGEGEGVPAAAALPESFDPNEEAKVIKAVEETRVPDYYDEMTYKEFASQAIFDKKAPPAPDKSRFTTSSYIAREIDPETGKVKKGAAFVRTTAYDQRSSGSTLERNKSARLQKELRTKSPTAGRTAASQIHARTMPFVPGSEPQQAVKQEIGDMPAAPVRAAPPVDPALNPQFGQDSFADEQLRQNAADQQRQIDQTYDQQKTAYDTQVAERDARIKRNSEIDNATKLGEQRRELGRAGFEAANPGLGEGFTPVGKFGEEAPKYGTKEYRDRNWAIRTQAERGGKKVVAAKTADGQYRSALAWFKRVRGQYNYRTAVAWRTYDRWRLGFGNGGGLGSAVSLGVDDESLTDKQREAIKKKQEADKAQPKSRGGVVYANTGMLIPYQPKGTDTVPAMLTPGEFVINRAATQKHLPLLKAINNGSAPKTLSSGGVVYLADGGEAVGSLLYKMGEWTPSEGAKQQLRAQKEQQDVAAAQREACRRKISEEEREKSDARSQVYKSGPDPEAQRQRDENEEKARQARAERNEAGIKLSQIRDDFQRQAWDDLAAIKEETGISNNEEIFAKIPRLRAEYQFIRKDGDFNIVTEGEGVEEFKTQINELLGLLTKDNWFTATNGSVKNMFQIQLKSMDEFYRAAGVRDNATLPQLYAQDPNNQARSKEQVKAAIEECNQQQQQKQPVAASRGGVIYASEGTLVNYQPRGTDTVPAMLTPGEFVVNRAATQKHLPLLRSINNGAQAYSKGGVVYLQKGGTEEEGNFVGGFAGTENEFFNSGANPKATSQGYDLASVRQADPYGILGGGNSMSPGAASAASAQSQQQSKSVDITDPQQVKEAVGALYTQLEPYVTNKDLLSQAVAMVGATTSFVQADQGTVDKFAGSKQAAGAYAGNESGGTIYFPNKLASTEAVRHELGHAFLSVAGAFNAPLQKLAPVMSFINNLAAEGVLPSVQKHSDEPKEPKEIKEPKEPKEPAPAATPEPKPMSIGGLVYFKDGGTTPTPKPEVDSDELADKKAERMERARERREQRLAEKESRSQAANSNTGTDIGLYSKQQLLKSPKEIFPTILQLLGTASFAQYGGSEALTAALSAIGFQKGGVIYANQGTLVNFQKQGTDTVPAMLTPGEFVVNRKAAQSNLGLLHSINSGSYQYGGKVGYYSFGWEVSGRTTAVPGSAAQMREEERKRKEEERKRQREANSAERRRALYEEDKRARSKVAASGYRPGSSQYVQAYQAERRSIYEEKKQKIAAGEQGVQIGFNPEEGQDRQQQGGPGGVRAMDPRVQQQVGMATQAAFDPRNYGDVNKQLVIFGTLLTGVNQVLTNFGAILQQAAAGGVNNAGAAANGAAAPAGGDGGNALAGLENFTNKFDAFTKQLQQLNIPPEVNVNLVQNKPWDINVNGAEALKALIEGPLGDIVQNAIQQWNTQQNEQNEGQS